jgi:phage protein D
VTLTNGGATLARLRVEQSYEQQSAGAVVRDLAGKANVTVGTAEDGIDFAFLVVDDRSSVLWHIAALARKCGHLAYLTPDDKLTFAAFKGGPAAQTFAYGVDLLAVELADAAPVAATVTVVGEGAAGANGADAWCWLVQDPAAVTTSAGSGTPERRVSDPSLRSAAAAGLAAAGLASSAGRWTTSGRLLVPGAPQATVGAVVAVKDAPQAEHNGDFLVTGVRHRYGKRTGFRTELLVSKSGAAAGGPGGLLGAAASALGGLL